MREKWRDILKWEGLYQASNLGRVRSLPRVVIRSNGRPCTVKGRILKSNPNSNGYPSVTMQESSQGRKVTLPVYQLVMRAFKGLAPTGLEILHGPKGKANSCLTNLSFGTHQQNGLNMLRDGLASAKPVRRSDGVLFPSIGQAAKSTGVKTAQLSQVIRHGRRYLNFYWRFEDE